MLSHLIQALFWPKCLTILGAVCPPLLISYIAVTVVMKQPIKCRYFKNEINAYLIIYLLLMQSCSLYKPLYTEKEVILTNSGKYFYRKSGPLSTVYVLKCFALKAPF